MSTPSYLVTLMTRPRLGRVKLGPEDIESIDFANRLRAWTLEGRLKAVWWHTASEVGGGAKNAAIRYVVAKALGLIPGAPDFVFLAPAGGFCLEMKAKSGSMSESQKDFQAWCAHAGIPYAVCKGADAAEAQLRAWGLLG